eukprot:TRINITY_DN24321_c0_g2_i1.p1 TRINITY_DN24321_c0_g2~~TRINITY_DN24321_c0_g2_i1.p1  ORF type:complete len:174 (+),score=6.67 TRINITY_DN24321_c0_g2_i1:99-620(+)
MRRTMRYESMVRNSVRTSLGETTPMNGIYFSPKYDYSDKQRSFIFPRLNISPRFYYSRQSAYRVDHKKGRGFIRCKKLSDPLSITVCKPSLDFIKEYNAMDIASISFECPFKKEKAQAINLITKSFTQNHIAEKRIDVVNKKPKVVRRYNKNQVSKPKIAWKAYLPNIRIIKL